MLQYAFCCFWWKPVYSSWGGCRVWCVFGWKQWMHHVEWIFASLRTWWTIITQTSFCSGRISITTLACSCCIWLCHPAVSCPPVSLHNTDDWLIICCWLVECSHSFVGLHKGLKIRFQGHCGTKLFNKRMIQCSRGVGRSNGTSFTNYSLAYLYVWLFD